MKNIGVLGSASIDNIFESSGIPVAGQRIFGHKLGSFVGGIGSNQATEIARYIPNVYFLGQLGYDQPAEEIISHLSRRGVNTNRVRCLSDYSTGQTYMFSVESGKDYFSIVDLGANNVAVEPSFDMDFWLSGLDILLVSLEINPLTVIKTIKESKKRGVEIWLSASPAECCNPESLEMSDNVILNLREAKLLLGISGTSIVEIAKSLQKVHPQIKNIVVSIGADGALLRTSSRNVLYAEAYDIGRVVDPVGAGDSLAGAFLAAKLNGLPDFQALCYGCIAGSLTVSVKGPQTSLHTESNLREIFEKTYKNKERSVL